MTTHWIWFPVQNLINLSRPEGPVASCFRADTLIRQFDATLKGATVVFARQTILQFFQAIQATQGQGSGDSPSRPVQSEALMLHDIIAWACLESFAESPITGWMREFTQAIPIKTQRKEPEETKSEVVSSAEAQRILARLLDSQIEQMSHERLNDFSQSG